MTPAQLSAQLRRIAAKIDSSRSPNKELVTKELRRVVATIDPKGQETELLQREQDEEEAKRIWDQFHPEFAGHMGGREALEWLEKVNKAYEARIEERKRAL
jgi:hypothetical protein